MKCNQKQLLTPIILSSLFLLISCFKEDIPPDILQENFIVESQHTKFTYTINICYPKAFSKENKYHVLYLLDGDDFYAEAIKAIQKEKRDDFVMVSIGYSGKNERGTDYSYPSDNDFPGESGGAKHFLDFLNTELLPKITTDFDIASIDNTIYGHSLGGFFALYVMLQKEKTNPFKYALTISPNLMWYNSYLIDLESNINFLETNLQNKGLYIAMGDLEGVGMNASFNALTNSLKKRGYQNFNFQYQLLKNTSHRNSPIKGLINGLKLIQ